MKAVLTRSTPRRPSYENALAAYVSGDSLYALELLDGSIDPTSHILEARSLLRVGKIDHALGAVERVAQSDVSHEVAAEALAFRIYLLRITRRDDEASALAMEARARCFSSGSVPIEAEIIFADAIGAFSVGDFERAESAISELLSLEDLRPSWIIESGYRLTLKFWRARAFDIRVVMAAATGDRKAETENGRLALMEFDQSGVKDELLATALLANYANAAIDGGDINVIEDVLGRANATKWTPFLAKHEFRIFSAVAEGLSNLGDQLGALRNYRRCGDCAPTIPLQVRASVERARLLSEVGEFVSAREELEHASRLCKMVDWESVDMLSQRQLIFLAAQIASYDGDQAQRLINRYEGLSTSLATNVSTADERFRGEELYARGAVARATGQPERAILLLIDSLTSFTIAKCSSRAALVAADLAEMTHEPHYIAIARENSVLNPLSIPAKKLARYCLQNPPTAPKRDGFSKKHLTLVR